MSKRVIVLGSTGSIGENTLRVVENLAEELEATALAAHSNWRRLIAQIERFRPVAVAVTDPGSWVPFEAALERLDGPRPRVYRGPEGLVALVRETAAEIVVGAISGAAGLPANVAALETGKDLALANKESLVMSGSILTRLARDRGRRLLPVDSEHSAIFQCLQAGRRDEVRAVILTASGGPFRTTSQAELQRVTREQALKHPTWEMGAKITIDSATLMNKSLEIIEAKWLFDLAPEEIEVVVHPQSIVHSMVEFLDGSTICQVGPPDMRVPIQYALTFPERRPLPVERLRWADIGKLSFEAPDPVRFPSIRLAYEVLAAGGTAPTVFNGANEVAVAAFLRGDLPFLGIFEVIERTLESHENSGSDPDLDAIRLADSWSRDEAAAQIAIVAR
jgi:1-deoxy-D-xylulose-5-phosphate reductoisomerase